MLHFGDVFYADLSQVMCGKHIQTGRRPVIVVSNDIFNYFSWAITIVPLTSRLKRPDIPTHVMIKEDGLKCLSMALCEQITTVDKDLLTEKICSVKKVKTHNKIRKRRSDLNPIKKHKRTYLLTGKIECGLCGHRYTGGTKHSGKDKLYEYISYSCCNKHNKTYDTCKNRDIRRDDLEDFVIREILRVVLADKRIPELVKKYRESYSERLSASNTEIAGMEANIRQLTTRIGNIVKVISKTGSDALLNELEALEKEKDRIENELNDVKSRLNGELISEEELTAAYERRGSYSSTAAPRKSAS